MWPGPAPWHKMLAAICQVGILHWVPAALIHMQSPATEPGKIMEDASTAWVPAIHVGNAGGVPDTWFHLLQPDSYRHLGKWTGREKTLSPSPTLCLSNLINLKNNIHRRQKEHHHFIPNEWISHQQLKKNGKRREEEDEADKFIWDRLGLSTARGRELKRGNVPEGRRQVKVV